jgi:hypothetical protein
MRFSRKALLVSFSFIAEASMLDICKTLGNEFTADYWTGRSFPNTDPISVGLSEGDYKIACDVPINHSVLGHTMVFLARDEQDNRFAVKYETTCGLPVDWPAALIKNHEMIRVVMEVEKKYNIDLTPDAVFLSSAIPLKDLKKGASFKGIQVSSVCREDFGEGRYMVMSLAGPSLYKAAAEAGQVPISAALNVGARIYHRLSILHREGIVHGDLSLHNVVLRDNIETRPEITINELLFVDWDRAMVERSCPNIGLVRQYDFDDKSRDIKEVTSRHSDVLSAFEIMSSLLAGVKTAKNVWPGTIATRLREAKLEQIAVKYEELRKKVEMDKSLTAKAMEAELRSLIDLVAAAASKSA